MITNIRDITCNLLFKIIYKKAYPDIVLNYYFKTNSLNQNDRSLITEIVYGVLRWRLKLEYIISIHTRNKQRNKIINILLLISLYQILYLDSIPDYAAVDESVKTAKKKFGFKISNFINAVLREIVRNKDSFTDISIHDYIKSISVNYSYPEWLIEYWSKYFNKNDIIYMCCSLNQRPLNTFRVNNLSASRDDLLNLLDSNVIINLTDISSCGISISGKSDLFNSDLYNKGLISVQDEASQLISIMLDPKPRDVILDLCSAPGTKSSHIAEIIDDNGDIISCDINPSRLKLVQQDCKRLGIKSVKTVCIDSANVHTAFDCKFDRILVDAPCSGLGTIKNNPDIKWNKTLKNILELASLQYRLLESASKLLKNGGILLYSVCTISHYENEDIIMNFLDNHSNFKIDKSTSYENKKINRLFNRKGYFTSFKKLHVMDGFFAVKFRKISNE